MCVSQGILRFQRERERERERVERERERESRERVMASFVAGIGISVFGSVASNFGVNGRFSSLHEKKKRNDRERRHRRYFL